MKRVGSGRRFFAAVLAAVLVVPSFGTALATRNPSLNTVIDPSLSAGEVALVHTTAGHAGALSHLLTDLGATDVVTEDAVDMVIARLSPRALTALEHDARVTLATHDTPIVMSGGRQDLDTIGDPSPADSVGLAAINAPRAWKDSTGRGVTVAVMDTGIADHPDLRGKIRARVDFVNDGATLLDPAGHGTHIAGVIAANGEMKGVAPEARLVSIRVLDANGNGVVSSVVKAFDWLIRHRSTYGIQVLNLSWGAPQATTYHKDLLAVLAECAWLSGVTVVAAAGNDGPTGHVATPASDPFVITAGSFDDQGTVAVTDDLESAFSSRGATLDGFAKPDVLAPGRHIVSLRAPGTLATTTQVRHARTRADATGEYIRMSGTSASAGFVSGVAALIAADHHAYTPTQVKGAIVAGARAMSGASAPALDAAKSVDAKGSANVGLRPSLLLLQVLLSSGVKLKGVTWEGVTWEGVTWESITWEQIRWQSVSWESVSWDSVSWESVAWEGVVWEKVTAK